MAPSSHKNCTCIFQTTHSSKYIAFCLVVLMLYYGTEVCRHGIPLKAVNIIKSGERYGLAHMIYWTDAVLKNTQIQYYDVACKVK